MPNTNCLATFHDALFKYAKQVAEQDFSMRISALIPAEEIRARHEKRVQELFLRYYDRVYGDLERAGHGKESRTV